MKRLVLPCLASTPLWALSSTITEPSDNVTDALSMPAALSPGTMATLPNAAAEAPADARLLFPIIIRTPIPTRARRQAATSPRVHSLRILYRLISDIPIASLLIPVFAWIISSILSALSISKVLPSPWLNSSRIRSWISLGSAVRTYSCNHCRPSIVQSDDSNNSRNLLRVLCIYKLMSAINTTRWIDRGGYP